MSIMPIIVPFKYGGNYNGIELVADTIVPYFTMKKKNFKLIEIAEELAEKDYFHNEKLKNIDIVIETNTKLRDTVQEIIKSGRFPLLIGGDHSLGLGSVAGVLEHYEDLGIIWIDAHGDMNTEKTTLSGNIHGMTLALLQGIGNYKLINVLPNGKKIKSENVLIFGIRDLDPLENELIKKHGINYLKYDDISTKGIEKANKYILDFFKNKVKHIHISLDLDSLNPAVFPGVSVPVGGGFNLMQLKETISVLFNNFTITSMDVVELNVMNDINKSTETAMVQIIDLVYKLVSSDKKASLGDCV